MFASILKYAEHAASDKAYRHIKQITFVHKDIETTTIFEKQFDLLFPLNREHVTKI